MGHSLNVMSKNYRFEILSVLYDARGNNIDILPLIKSLVEENIFSRLYFSIMLQNMNDNQLISYTDYGDETKAMILPPGIAEYRRLRRHCALYGAKQLNNKK